jgi:hypothetical protein
MVVTVRFLICFLTLMAVGGTAAVLPSEWATDLCLSSWTPDNALSEERQRAGELDDANRAEQRRIMLRIDMTKRVIDQSASLVEAAALFHQLNQELPQNSAVQDFPDCSPEEAACRQVIKWVRVATMQEGDMHVRRLEEELRRHKEQYGGVLLPDAADRNQ